LIYFLESIVGLEEAVELNSFSLLENLEKRSLMKFRESHLWEERVGQEKNPRIKSLLILATVGAKSRAIIGNSTQSNGNDGVI